MLKHNRSGVGIQYLATISGDVFSSLCLQQLTSLLIQHDQSPDAGIFALTDREKGRGEEEDKLHKNSEGQPTRQNCVSRAGSNYTEKMLCFVVSLDNQSSYRGGKCYFHPRNKQSHREHTHKDKWPFITLLDQNVLLLFFFITPRESHA